jgi:putative zinc finger/helix-turn-helix YgiT family protein
MNNDYLIKKLDTECPICDKVHTLEIRKRHSQTIVKEEAVEYEETYYSCPLSDGEENEYVPAALMDENLLRARDSYRMKRGLLTSFEIASIRSMYGMSQSDFAALLGWGDVTVTRYESKLIQDETYDIMMRMVSEDPLFALERLERNKSRFSSEKYEKIRSNIKRRINEIGVQYLNKRVISGIYAKYDDDNDLNGGRQLDIEKVISVIGYFARFVSGLNAAKLMALLWYADVLSYLTSGRSMMGLVYVHKATGALPVGYREILSFPSIDAEERLMCDEIGYIIKPKEDVRISDFTLEELGILETVSRTFKDSSPQEVYEKLSSEKAFLETEPGELIPYSLVKHLNLQI